MKLLTQIARVCAVALLIMSAPKVLEGAKAVWTCQDSINSAGELCYSCANYEEGCSEWDSWIWACCNMSEATCRDGREERPGACEGEGEPRP